MSPHLDRALAAQLGREAMLIGEQGRYTTPSGKTIDIKPLVSAAVKKTVSYPPKKLLPEENQGPHDTKIEINNETTLSAAKRLLDNNFNPAALNFASATHPGGGFLSGAQAQEEYLARSSCLYECIRSNPMYDFHRKNYDPMYTDYVIYSPGVPVIRDDKGNLFEKPYPLSIITSPAVNATQVPKEKRGQIKPVMFKRILKVLSVGCTHSHDSLVLGAWGCGAFGNDSRDIAQLFHQALTKNFCGAYKRVIFAVLDWTPNQWIIGSFKSVFKEK
ncbi:MAG: TIGR02452 family protein [Acidobacteriota bacterium]